MNTRAWLLPEKFVPKPIPADASFVDDLKIRLSNWRGAREARRVEDLSYNLAFAQEVLSRIDAPLYEASRIIAGFGDRGHLFREADPPTMRRLIRLRERCREIREEAIQKLQLTADQASMYDYMFVKQYMNRRYWRDFVPELEECGLAYTRRRTLAGYLPS